MKTVLYDIPSIQKEYQQLADAHAARLGVPIRVIVTGAQGIKFTPSDPVPATGTADWTPERPGMAAGFRIVVVENPSKATLPTGEIVREDMRVFAHELTHVLNGDVKRIATWALKNVEMKAAERDLAEYYAGGGVASKKTQIAHVEDKAWAGAHKLCSQWAALGFVW